MLVVLSCSSDDGSDIATEIRDFPSFGTIQATFNGETTTFSAKKAKQFAGPFLQIAGTNCSKRILVGFDIPFSVGTYSLEHLGSAFVFLQSASACPNTQGGNTPQITESAMVTVTQFSDTRVKGTFSITAGQGEGGSTTVVITNGSFDVERE